MEITSEKFSGDDTYLVLKICGPERNETWKLIQEDLVAFMVKEGIREKLKRATMMDGWKEIVLALKQKDFLLVAKFIREKGFEIGKKCH